MTEQEIKQAAEDYFKEMLIKDDDYLDIVTDSWIYDAEDWFLNLLSQKGINRFILKKKECDYQEELVDLVHIFREIAFKRYDELYDEKYGKRDALCELYIIIRDIKGMKKRFESIKHNLKEFPKLNDSISSMLNDVEGCLESLEKLELESEKN